MTDKATPGTTVFVVTHFGTVALLQSTIDQLPMVEATVDGVDYGEANVTVTAGDPGLLKFAFERRGYARIVRIAESHGPNTGEIPTTRP